MNTRLKRSLGELGAAPLLGAVALLAVNDHLLKAAFHNTVTGKLSDLAICFLLPLLIAGGLGLLADWPVRRRLWIGAVVGGAVFGLLEMSDTAEAIFQGVMRAVTGSGVVLTRDATDLWALLCVPLAFAYGRRRITTGQQTRWVTATGALALVGGGLALAATSPAAVCAHWSPPMIFQADPGCGAGGVFVVEPDSFRGGLTIFNRSALGFPEPAPTGPQPSFSAYFDGESCPFQLDDGDWTLNASECPSGTTNCASRRQCTVAKNAMGELWMICKNDLGNEVCRSHIKVTP